MSGSISFVGTDNFKQVIHTFCNVARTDLLYHTLNPSEKTIERRLQAIWARTWKKDFSDIETAQAFVTSELQDIHLNVYIHYSKDIKATDTIEKTKVLARSSFKQADKATQTICKQPLPTHAIEVKSNLRDVWTHSQNTLGYLPLELAKLEIETSLANALVPLSIKNLYLEDLCLANTPDGLKNRLQSYLNDLEVKGEGITSTSLGSQGYPKIIDVQRGERILGFMKTLGNSLEMDYHLLYSFFLNDCLSQEKLHIQVPNASMFDIEKAQYVDSIGKKYDISKYSEQIKHLLNSVASLNTEASRSSSIDEEIKFQSITQTCPVGFFDLVDGLNLADFFREKYSSLSSEQKDRFWFSTGLIAYLDLILGNRDRLIRLLPDMDKGQYSFLTTDENPIQESNLGNLMISHDFTQFYAIDNGIGDGQRSSFINIADEEAYTAFLSNFLERADCKTLASDYLISSLKLAIETAFQEADYNANSLDSVLSDLSLRNHIASLSRGMEYMEYLLTEIILPKWNHADADPIRKTLDETFVTTIQTRLDFFAKLKKKPREPQIDASSESDDILSELQFTSFDEWNSPERDLLGSRATPFSPVMSGSKNMAIKNIASHLKDLSIEIASQDTLRRILALLNSLESDFLLPPDIQVKIAEIKPKISDSTSDKDSLTSLIKELATSLLSINPFMISPRATRPPSWDEKEGSPANLGAFSKGTSFSLFEKK